MVDLMIFCAGAAAGLVLAVYGWPALRTFMVGAETELAELKARAAALETKLRAALGRGQS
jgi:hypothetical protein